MVNVSAQDGCTITPINPATLTAAGGILPSGTVNVMIQCNCTENDGTLVATVRWYDPAGVRLISLAAGNQFDETVPHFTRIVEMNDTNIILVIPTFTDSYDGVYTCAKRGSNNALETPNAPINLTIRGDIFVN